MKNLDIYKDQLNCHSGTHLEEIESFVKSYKNHHITIHYENNIYDTWGDDELIDIYLDDNGMEEALEIIRLYYIHNIFIK